MPTLIVENGQKLANANSYVSLADARLYHAAIGNDWESLDDEELTQALFMAGRSVDLLYGDLYLGSFDPYSEQAMLFGREVAFVDNRGRVVPANTIPKCLKDAQCEIAQLFLDGVSILPVDESETAVKVKKVSVDVISEESQYYRPVGSASYSNFDSVKRILSPILRKAKARWTLRA